MCFNNNIIDGEYLAPVKCIYAPSGLGCCRFESGGSVVVDSLLYVHPIVCGGSVFVFFVLSCISLISSFAITLTRKRKLATLL